MKTRRPLLCLMGALVLVLPVAATLRGQDGDEPKRLSSSELRAAKKAFEAGIRDDDPDGVEAEVLAYAGTGDPKAIDQIIKDALYSDDAVLIRAAERALAGLKGARAVDAASDAWRDAKKEYQKVRLLRVLGNISVKAADKAIRGVGREKSFVVREQAMRAVEKLDHKDYLELSLKRLKDDHPRVRHAAGRAVRALGGEVPDKWATKQHETEYLPRALPSAGVMFVIDASETMQAPTAGAKPGVEGPPKYQVVGPDIAKHAGAFGKDVKWNAMTFNLGTKVFSRKDPKKGTKGARDIADWIGGRVRVDRTRDTLKALEAAIDNEWVDTIVLVSDGLPKEGRINDPERIIDRVVPRCRDLGIAIHTVALMSPEVASGASAEQVRQQQARKSILDFLETLATWTGGIAKVVEVTGPTEIESPEPGAEPGTPSSGGGGRERPGGGGTESGPAPFTIELRNGRAASSTLR